MTSFAERTFYLAAKEGDQSRRAKIERDLERAVKRGGRPHLVEKLEADLVMPPFPQALAYLWRAYLRMRGRKTMGFAGPAPVEWPDIDAFLRCSGLRLAPWELEIIEMLDDRFLQAQVTATASPPDPNLVALAPVEDPRAVKSILAGIGQRRSINKKKGERSNG